MRSHASQHFIAAVVALALAATAWADVAGVLQKYTISPGDMLTIQVFGEPDMSGDYRVGPSGTIVLPLIGNVEVGGLRLDEANDAVSDALRRIIRRPAVSVALNELDSQRKVYVSGHVATQGPIMLPLGATVADAVAAAGVVETGDLRAVKVKRATGESMTVDISGLQTDRPFTDVPPVRNGDVIYVPKLTDRIAVLGEVKTPGHLVVPLDETVTVLEAIGRLGGGLTENADHTTALVIREGQTAARIDLKRLLREGDLSQNMTLQPGDVVVVLEAGKVSVLGEVNQPSTFQVGEPITVLEALARAGGVTADADLDNGQLITADSVQPVDLAGLLERGEMSNNLEVKPGDVVLVPKAAPETVLILGAVEHPGVIDIRQQQQRDLLRLLTYAAPTKNADLERTYIYRNNERISADMRAALEEGRLEENIALQPDDIVMVPELMSIYVLGATYGPRMVPLTADMTLLDVVAMSADWRRGDMAHVTIIRTGEDGQGEPLVFNMAAMHKGKVPENPRMQEGDIVYIPTVKGPFDWSRVRNALWVAATLLGLFRF